VWSVTRRREQSIDFYRKRKKGRQEPGTNTAGRGRHKKESVLRKRGRKRRVVAGGGVRTTTRTRGTFEEKRRVNLKSKGGKSY